MASVLRILTVRWELTLSKYSCAVEQMKAAEVPRAPAIRYNGMRGVVCSQLERSMSLIQTKSEVEYPESDGKPLGETDLHIDWILRLRAELDRRGGDDS